MTIETRLATCKAYREEALKHPKANRLYLEDLELSIAMFEEAVKHNTIVLQKGFIDSE
jgi:hypothetical protein